MPSPGRREFYVYILASRTKRLYIGVTNDLERPVREHRSGKGSVFTAKYRVSRLVYYETTNDPRVAIAREKELKGWVRWKKVDLIEAKNPNWVDLAEGW